MHLEFPGIHSLGHTLHSSVNLFIACCSTHNLHHLNGIHIRLRLNCTARWVGRPFGRVFSISAYPEPVCSSGSPGSAPWAAPALPPRPAAAGSALPCPQRHLQGFPAAKCTPLQGGWTRHFTHLKGKKLVRSQYNVNTIKNKMSPWCHHALLMHEFIPSVSPG